MTKFRPNPRHRILVIDDNPAIHEDFRKVLCGTRASTSQLEAAEAAIFETRPPLGMQSEFDIDSAYQAEEGLARVHHAIQEGRPYAMAFVDVRMPPGSDGLEITPKLWVADPQLPIVICTAFADYTWEQMFAKIGNSDRMFILKKPFDREEVLQLAHALSARRQGAQKGRGRTSSQDTAVLRAHAVEPGAKLHAEITQLKRQTQPPL